MAAIFIGLALVLVSLEERHASKQLKPEQLLLEINNEDRYISTDDVARSIISDNEFMQLIDVRSPEEFNEFHLKGAINIPLERILDKNKKGKYEYKDVFDQDIKTNVLYSNGTVYASQTWVILRRMRYKNNYIMKGGLNRWIETVIQPTKPPVTATDNEMALYHFRKAASMYFGGGAVAAPSKDNAPTPIIKKRSGQQEEEGGC
jgi:rhodanese-related sulfurtransferase